jgi:hypothetical protein
VACACRLCRDLTWHRPVDPLKGNDRKYLIVSKSYERFSLLKGEERLLGCLCRGCSSEDRTYEVKGFDSLGNYTVLRVTTRLLMWER